MENLIRYDTTTIALHWAVAVCVFSVGASAFFLKTPSPWIHAFHNTAGTVGFAVAIGWHSRRITQRALTPLPTRRRSERRVMQVTYGILFGLIVVVPALGIAEVFATGHSINLGLRRLSYPLTLTSIGLSNVINAHHLLGVLLLIVGGVHALTAVWHHFVTKDTYAARMLPTSFVEKP